MAKAQGGEPGNGAASLVCPGSETAPTGDVQALQRQALRGETCRRRRALPQPAREGGRALHGRKEPKAGARSHAPSLPMKQGRAGTIPTATSATAPQRSFTALDVLSGTVIGQCLRRHRHEEFLQFLRTIDRQAPKGLAVYLILYNYSTHTHANVGNWLADQTSPLPPPLHSGLELVTEPRRALVRQADRQGHSPRRLPLRPRADRRDRGLPTSHQRQAQPIRMDRHHRLDPHHGSPRPRHSRTNH